MKFLKYFLLLIAVLIIVFIAKGLFTPTVSYDCSVTTNKSLEEAWAVINDESRMSEWIKGFKRSELISGKASTVGAISNVYVDNNGEEMVMKETITSITPKEHVAMNFSMDIMNMDYEMRLKEENGKTQIETRSVTSGNGIFAKSIVSFMGGSMKAQEEANLSALKKLIDQNSKNYLQP